MISQRFNELEKLRDEFGIGNDTRILEEIVDAMSSSEFHEIYEHICSMCDIDEEE